MGLKTAAEQRVINAVVTWTRLHRAYWPRTTSEEIQTGKARGPQGSRKALRDAELEVFAAQDALERAKGG